MVGDVAVGGSNPIRIQSMTTTRTQDVDTTAAQAERLVTAGCEIVRITAPTVKDTRAIGEVRRVLHSRGIHVPLVADIHFSPEAALAAADYCDKVRINPGNYADSRKFAVREYTDAEYDSELARIEERVAPLVLKLRERGLALRIGTNHGSLSDRIMNRYGDTPRGMVESALEFVRICERFDFQDIILSMKASNPLVMIAAYRLLAARMETEGMDYPFHLGVTEAGNGEDARIKSSVGIGALLLDGIGDTVRVSLAEEPEEEVPVARALATLLSPSLIEGGLSEGIEGRLPEPSWDPLEVGRRSTRTIRLGASRAGGSEHALVLTPLPREDEQHSIGVPRTLTMAAGVSAGAMRPPRPDAVIVDVTGDTDVGWLSGKAWKRPGAPRTAMVARGTDPELLLRATEWVDGAYLTLDSNSDAMRDVVNAASDAGIALVAEAESVGPLLEVARRARDEGLDDVALALVADGPLATLHGYRHLAAALDAEGLDVPLHLRYAADDPLVPASAVLGALLCDGIGDIAGIEDGAGRPLVPMTFNLLQATRRRITKTDYVACPSCGRTLFDLQTTTERIKARTVHLVGVKIAIMGCVVNGPGEMADADFGYVGGAPGKVNLYVGKDCVERNVAEEDADERLVELIKSRGRWVEETDLEIASTEAESR